MKVWAKWHILILKMDYFIQQKLSKTQITIFTIFCYAKGNFHQEKFFKLKYMGSGSIDFFKFQEL